MNEGSFTSRILVLDDLEGDRSAVARALLEEGLTSDEISMWADPYKARDDLARRFAAGGVAPLVAIVDHRLKAPGGGFNGQAFLRGLCDSVNNRWGHGLWTLLVSADAMGHLSDRDKDVPYQWFSKKEGWSGTIARTVAPLFSPELPTDSRNNDLAPTATVTAADRLFVYLGKNPRFTTLRRVRRQAFVLDQLPPRNHERAERGGAWLMYRGQAVELPEPSIGRLLLRWRTVARFRQRDTARVEIAGIADDAGGVRELGSLAEGVPVRGGEEAYIDKLRPRSSFSRSRGRSEDSPLQAFLKAFIGEHWDELLPRLGKAYYLGGRNHPAPKEVFDDDGRVDLDWAARMVNNPRTGKKAWALGPRLPCPPDLLDDCPPQVRGGFLSRIQFVLSEAELDNYRSWRRQWDHLESQGQWHRLEEHWEEHRPKSKRGRDV